MIRSAPQVTGPADRTVAAARLARLMLASTARAATGAEVGRPRPTGPSGYWLNPSSMEGGRPWPPAPPYW